MIRITQIRMSSGGNRHEHIERLRWVNPATGKTGENTRAQIVQWIEVEKGRAIVSDGVNNVEVLVVNATPKYLRTYADGKWTDNLLALPRF